MVLLTILNRNPGEGGNKMEHHRVMNVVGCVIDLQNIRSGNHLHSFHD